MAQPLVTALETALGRCAAADLSLLSGAEVAGLVVDLRRVATRLEAEIARVVHAAAGVGVWRVAGATSMEAWLADQTKVSIRSARDQVRLAATLAAAPIVADKMADGDLSIDNVRLLGAVVGNNDFEHDADLRSRLLPVHRVRRVAAWSRGWRWSTPAVKPNAKNCYA